MSPKVSPMWLRVFALFVAASTMLLVQRIAMTNSFDSAAAAMLERHVIELKMQVCHLRHERNLAVMGDNFTSGKLLYTDFTEMWRDERARFMKECFERKL